MAGIDLAGVFKSFGATPVLQDINLAIEDGEFVVFVGPSGCGKSTLLRVIAGLEEVSAGTVRIGEVDVTHAAPAKRGVAMVFQSYALYPHMTVAENMGFGLKLAGAPRREVDEAVQSAARILRIYHLLDRKPRALSGGQRQRVAIGRAITRKPGVFLLDEPLSNLDAALRVSMRYEFAKLHDDLKTTMVYVTHDQVEAMTLADRIVVLSAGRIEQVGAPMDLYQRPANTFVAGFIGSPTMNFIPGSVVSRSDCGLQVRLETGEIVEAAVEAAIAQPGDRVKIGIRPEQFDASSERNSITANVRFVEQLGSATFAYAMLPGSNTEITVQLAGDAKVHTGAKLHLGVPPAACHVFDAEGLAFKRIDRGLTAQRKTPSPHRL